MRTRSKQPAAAPRRSRLGSGVAAVVAVTVAMALLGGGTAQAIEPYLLSVGILGGLGGPLDAADPDPGVDQQALQLQVGLLTEARTLVVLRVGRLEMDDDATLGGLAGPKLEYATIAGEYRFYKEWYDSGIFLGLGGYRLQGDRAGVADDDTSIGLTLGVTGEIELTRMFSVVAELAGHWADLDGSQLFGAGQVGLAVKF
jgi:hypothetical protein